MRRPRPTSFTLLLVYTLALLLPQREDRASQGAAGCPWYPAFCTDPVLSVHAHAGGAAASGHPLRVLIDAGRVPAGLLEQFRQVGPGATPFPQTGGECARAAVTLLQHQAVRQVIRSADAGFRASFPRAPPVLS